MSGVRSVIAGKKLSLRKWLDAFGKRHKGNDEHMMSILKSGSPDF